MDEIYFTETEYIFMHEILLDFGYQKISKRQKAKEVIRLGFQAPRPIYGSETGYFYSNNGYTAKFWTSWLEDEKKFREESTDAFWSIIAHGDELAYSAKPIKREGFESILDALRYAFVTKLRVDNVPLCPCKNCLSRMSIFRRPGTRQYMWVCKKKDRHPDEKWSFRGWDYGLRQLAKEFVKVRRNATAEYKKRCKREGRTPTPAALIRKKWKIGRPWNFIPRND